MNAQLAVERRAMRDTLAGALLLIGVLLLTAVHPDRWIEVGIKALGAVLVVLAVFMFRKFRI